MATNPPALVPRARSVSQPHGGGDFTDPLHILKILTSSSNPKIDRGGRGHFPLLDLYTFSSLQSGRDSSRESSRFSSDTSHQIHATKKALHKQHHTDITSTWTP